MRLLAPNQTVPKSTATALAIVQASLLIIFWFFSPFIFFPTIAETWHAMASLWRDGLGVELVTSLTLNLEAIAAATIISLVLAYSTVMPFFRPIVAFISKLRFLSLVGLTFFFTLATRDGHTLKLDLLAFSIAVFFVTSMADVIASIPKAQYDLAYTLRMSPWRVVWEVVVLGQMDRVFDVLRQNAAIGWMMLSMVEGMSRSEGGVGALLMTQNRHFHLAAVLAIQACILTLGLAQDYAIAALKCFFCPYASMDRR